MAGFFQSTGFRPDAVPATAGTYVCRLASLNIVQRPKYQQPGVFEDQYEFAFETTQVVDRNGNPYRFRKWTGMTYGSDRAHLTALMDTMLGQRYTSQQWSQLNDQILFGGSWNVTVDWVAPRNENSEGSNIIVSVYPATPAPQQAYAAQAPQAPVAQQAGWTQQPPVQPQRPQQPPQAPQQGYVQPAPQQRGQRQAKPAQDAFGEIADPFGE
jgi:hypothetical protein